MAERGRVHFGITLGRGAPSEVLGQARLAWQSGFDSIWMMDHLNGFPADKGALEPFTMLGAISRECPGLSIGCAATDPFRRHPAILAQTLATLAGLSKGRIALVIGAGEAMNLVPFGFDHDRALPHIRESILVIRRLLASAPQAPVNFDGDFYHLESAFLQMEERVQAIPIYMATNSPSGMKLAAEFADGWVSLLLTPELLEKEGRKLREASLAVGRSESAVEVVHHIDIALASDVARGLSLIRESAGKLLLGFPSAAERLGSQMGMDDFNWKQLIVNHSNQERLAAAITRVPDSMLKAISIVGSEADCMRTIDQYVDAGVRHFIFRSGNRIQDLGAFISTSLHGRY